MFIVSCKVVGLRTYNWRLNGNAFVPEKLLIGHFAVCFENSINTHRTITAICPAISTGQRITYVTAVTITTIINNNVRMNSHNVFSRVNTKHNLKLHPTISGVAATA